MARQPFSDPDAWGRPRPPLQPALSRVAAMSPTEAWVWIVLRGFVFVPGALLALYFAFGLALAGLLPALVLAQLALVPASVVCWVKASAGKGGDWWTLGYVAFWLLEIGLLSLGAWIV